MMLVLELFSPILIIIGFKVICHIMNCIEVAVVKQKARQLKQQQEILAQEKAQREAIARREEAIENIDHYELQKKTLYSMYGSYEKLLQNEQNEKKQLSYQAKLMSIDKQIFSINEKINKERQRI